jgi:hypothetical protein
MNKSVFSDTLLKEKCEIYLLRIRTGISGNFSKYVLRN